MNNTQRFIEKERLDIDEMYLFQTLIPNDLRHIKKIVYALNKSVKYFKNIELIEYCGRISPQFEIAFKFLYDISIENQIEIDILELENKNATIKHPKECKCLFKSSGIVWDTHKGFNVLTTFPLDCIADAAMYENDTVTAFFLEHIIEALAISSELRLNQIKYLYDSDLKRAKNKEFIQTLQKYYRNLFHYCSYHDKIFEKYSS